MAGVSSDDEVRSGASSPSVFASAVEFDWEAALAAPIPPCMKLLEKSVAQNKIIAGSEFATLATISDDGSPASRTIWLRDLHHSRALLFTTDARTPKLRQLSRTSSPSSPPLPPAEVCWWLPMSKERFCLTVHPTIITSTHPSPTLQHLRRTTWDTTPDWLQRTFDNPPPGLPKQEGPPLHPSCVMNEQFVVVLLWPVRCDYLRLPIAVIDNTRPLHRESRLKPQKERQRWLHTRHSPDHWSVLQLNP